MARKGPDGKLKRRKFRISLDAGRAPEEQAPAREQAAEPAGMEDDARAANYLEEESQRPFTPEVYLIKKPRR